MQLHKYIPNKELPEALKKPLVFGNREQIEALNGLEVDIEIMETEEAKVAEGDLKYFNVYVEVEGFIDIKVLAVDKIDAEEKAMEDVDIDSLDMETSAYAKEIKI